MAAIRANKQTEHKRHPSPTKGPGDVRWLIGIDPDSTHPAACVLEVVPGVAPGDAVCLVAALVGGGTRAEGAMLSRAQGAAQWLGGYPGARVCVERATPRGLWSESVEGVARDRGKWIALVDLSGGRCVGVLPRQWQVPLIKLAGISGAPASRKPYHRAALAITADMLTAPRNEDQAAALGVALWFAGHLGYRVDLAPAS